MNSSARTTRSRRWTAVVVGGAATGAVLLGGGIALADGSGGDTAPASGAPSGAPAPADDRLVGTVTAVSDDSITLTDDTGTSHDVALSDETRYGGPGGPGAGGPGGPAGGPGGPAGGPGAGGPAPSAPADGSTPPAPADGSDPAAPTDGSTPSDGSAPAAPSDGSAPAAPSDGSAPAAPSDGSAPAAPSDGSAPAAPTDGSTPERPADGSRPAAGSLDDIEVGDRVEVRVSDGTALEVREVRATVDGTVVSVDGTDLTVVTTPGLRVDVDAAALSALPTVGDDVHLHGTVSQDGTTVVADDSDTGPR